MADAVRLDELVAAMGRRAVPVTAEGMLFILLEAVEAMGPTCVALTQEAVLVQPDGSVSLVGGGPTVSETDAIKSVGEVLSQVLMPPPTMVMDFVLRARDGRIGTRAALGSEVLSLLVPLNRAAGRRMVSRLVREHARAEEAAQAAQAVKAHDDGVHRLFERASPDDDDATATTPEGRSGGGDATDTLLDERARLAWAEDEDREESLDADETTPLKRANPRSRELLALGFAAAAVAGAAVFLWQRMHG